MRSGVDQPALESTVQPEVILTPSGKLPVGAKKTRIGRLPKAKVLRRLLGSGAEYLFYHIAILLVAVLSFFTGTFLGLMGTLPLCALMAVRDLNGGVLSIGKRISRLRVVDAETGLVARNSQALLRNSYYILLLLLMMLPAVEFLGAVLFPLLVLLDILMIITSPEGRRLGDLMAGTQVVQVVRG